MLKQKNYFYKKDGLGHLFYHCIFNKCEKRSFKESVLSLTFSPYSANFEPPSFTRSTTFKTESNSSSDKSSTIDNNFWFPSNLSSTNF